MRAVVLPVFLPPPAVTALIVPDLAPLLLPVERSFRDGERDELRLAGGWTGPRIRDDRNG